MNAVYGSLLTTLLCASAALAQVPLPPHSAIYNGFTRGYTFTAQTNFFINQVGLPPEAQQAGDLAGFLIRVNGATSFYSTGNVGPNVSCMVQVNTGDVVDVMGNWSPAVPNNFSAHNSYPTTATNYATTIEGVPHTIQRSGWQWDISDPAYTSAAFLTPTTGQIGRVFIWTNPPAGLYARFSATPVTGASPLQVQFTDNSFTSDPGGVLTWAWDFDGDGIVDSNLQNPTHTYATCGDFTVSLRVTDATHPASTETKTNFIRTDPVTASFTVTHLAGNTYQFTDTSTPTPTSWAWDFNGDSVIDSTAQNPTFTYPAGCNAYNASLAVTLNCRNSSTTRPVFTAPNNLATIHPANNGLTGANVGVFFDLTVLPAEGVSVCALSVLPYSTAGLFNANVYIRPGTHVGNTSPASAWRLVGTGTGTSVGGTSATAVLTDVSLVRPIYLPQGSYGVAVYIVPATGTMGHAYVTGTATNQNHGNADLQFAAGGSTTALFPATLTTPRVWSGRIYYSKNSQTGDGGYGVFGYGCAGTQSVSTNVATALPRLGQTMSATLNNLPANAAFFLLGFSRTNSTFGPLPVDLAAFGAPGCFGRVSPDAVNLLTGSGGSLNWTLTIPNNPIYLGNQMYTQGIVVDPGFNSLGGVMSDASAFIVGQ